MTAALFATLHTLAQGGTLTQRAEGYLLTDALSSFVRTVRHATIVKLALAGYLDDNLQLTPTGREEVARLMRTP